uniref:Uncharacterized protein n=1 Tax=Cacopsylla melanoneura TaxID=428564 RepID=A0A8D9ELE6_9HEMI
MCFWSALKSYCIVYLTYLCCLGQFFYFVCSEKQFYFLNCEILQSRTNGNIWLNLVLVFKQKSNVNKIVILLKQNCCLLVLEIFDAAKQLCCGASIISSTVRFCIVFENLNISPILVRSQKLSVVAHV